MSHQYNLRKRRSRFRAKKAIVVGLCGVLLGAGGMWWYDRMFYAGKDAGSHHVSRWSQSPPRAAEPNAAATPLTGRSFYVDNNRIVARQAGDYLKQGKSTEAALLNRIASQPGTTWLTGPSAHDSTAERDIAAVRQISILAAQQNMLSAYQLYAIPNRDACAAHSRGGFAGDADYLAWIDRILGALQSDAVFIVEADAIAQAVGSNCMTEPQRNQRYQLLKQAVIKLSRASRIAAVYLDAGHPEWLPDPGVLVGPLQKSGIEHARGVAVNVSFFAETNTVASWSQELLRLIGGEKGAIIDTSRNGKGVYDGRGNDRWCNPPGRAIGPAPTTTTGLAGIDAYMWIKNIGESDGNCAGYPAAGVFVPEIALELARNSR